MKCPHGTAIEKLNTLIAAHTDECITWPYARTVNGYGAIRFEGRNWGTHVVAWHLFNKHPLPAKHGRGNTVDGLCICHICDNPPCVNPRHLFPGTIGEDHLDKTRKGRTPAGERHYSTTLIAEQVREIRASKESSGVMAFIYNVCPKTIRNIRNRYTWSSVK
jgi:hypothetical protein